MTEELGNMNYIPTKSITCITYTSFPRAANRLLGFNTIFSFPEKEFARYDYSYDHGYDGLHSTTDVQIF